jgi:hypothetical protein
LTQGVGLAIVSSFKKYIDAQLPEPHKFCYSEIKMPRPLKTTSRPTDPTVSSLAALGRLVAAQRVASGLRIDDAAALSGVSVDLLSRLENGKSGVSTERLLKVLDALGLAMLIVDKASLPKALTVLAGPDEPPAR